MDRTISPRRLLGPLAALAIIGLTAGAVAASGASHARATLVDGAGNPVGWAKFTEDAAGRLHLNVKVSGLTPGLHGIHIHGIGTCTGPASPAPVAITTRMTRCTGSTTRLAPMLETSPTWS